MAHPYKLTIPRTKGELDGLLGWMVLSCPDFTGDWPGRNIDTAFEELELGIAKVLGPGAKRDAMQSLAKALRNFCDEHQTKAAIEVLDAMSELLRRKTVH